MWRVCVWEVGGGVCSYLGDIHDAAAVLEILVGNGLLHPLLHLLQGSLRAREREKRERDGAV